MKKIILIIIALFSAFICTTANEKTNLEYQHDISLANPSKENTTHLVIQDNGELPNYKSFCDDLLSLAREYSVSIYKTIPLANENKIEGYLYLSNMNTLNKKRIKYSKSDISYFNQNYNAKITNYDNSESLIQLPKMNTNTHFTFYSFQNSTNNQVDGFYYFIGNRCKEFKTQLLKEYSNLKTEVYGLDHVNEISLLEVFSKQIIAYGWPICLIILLCLISHFTSRKREFAIKKIHGFSNLKLIFSENKRLLVQISAVNFFVFGVFVMFNYGSMLFSFYGKQLILNFLMLVIIQYILLLLVFTILLLFIRVISISMLIKRYSVDKWFLYLNILIRVMILICSLTVFTNHLPQLISSFHLLSSYTSFEKETEGFKKINYIQKRYSPEKDYQYIKELSDIVNRTGSISIDTSSYNPKALLAGKWMESFIKVNANFVNSSEIFDKDGNVLKIKDLSENQIILLLPYHSYEAFRKNIIDFCNTEQNNTSVIWIKDNQVFQTFDNTLYEGRLGFVRNNMFFVSNFQNANEFLLKSDIEIQNKIIYDLNEKNLYSKLDFIDSNYFNKENYDMQLIIFKDAFFPISIFIVCLLISIIHFSLQYFDYYEKHLIIKKLYGFSLINRSVNLILTLLGFYSLLYLYIIFFERTILNITILNVVLFMDVISTLCVLVYKEKRSNQERIKG